MQEEKRKNIEKAILNGKEDDLKVRIYLCNIMIHEHDLHNLTRFHFTFRRLNFSKAKDVE